MSAEGELNEDLRWTFIETEIQQERGSVRDRGKESINMERAEGNEASVIDEDTAVVIFHSTLYTLLISLRQHGPRLYRGRPLCCSASQSCRDNSLSHYLTRVAKDKVVLIFCLRSGS